MGFIFLIIALTLNASANILMKIGAAKLPLKGEVTTIALAQSVATNTHLIIGVVLFAINVIFYVLALSKLNLSLAYPLMTSGGFLIITLFTFFYLKEPISPTHIAGLVLILLGIILVSSNIK